MIKVALITEGITDQYIIRPIVENYFSDSELVFNSISPRIDETERQSGFGGWTNVIKSCQEEDFEEMFKYNDFVIIQFDADIANNKAFGLSLFENGKPIDMEILTQNVISKIQSQIQDPLFKKYSDRFVFAVGIFTIECWLIALLNTSKVKKETNNCLYKLNDLLKKKNQELINPKDKNSFKSKSVYKKLATNFKNKMIIEKYSKFNIGFEIFVKQLNDLQVIVSKS